MWHRKCGDGRRGARKRVLQSRKAAVSIVLVYERGRWRKVVNL